MIDLSTVDARKALAAKYAAKYNLDPALVAAVCEHETGGTWDPTSCRYEPAFYARYLVNLPIPADSIRSIETERTLRACSFGLMQIMGQTAREMRFTGRYLTQLCDPDLGVDYGCRKLRRAMDNHLNDVSAALLSYNGGGDANYPSQVMARMVNYA